MRAAGHAIVYQSSSLLAVKAAPIAEGIWLWENRVLSLLAVSLNKSSILGYDWAGSEGKGSHFNSGWRRRRSGPNRNQRMFHKRSLGPEIGPCACFNYVHMVSQVDIRVVFAIASFAQEKCDAS